MNTIERSALEPRRTQDEIPSPSHDLEKGNTAGSNDHFAGKFASLHGNPHPIYKFILIPVVRLANSRFQKTRRSFPH